MEEEGKSGPSDTLKWLVGITITLIAAYFSHQKDIALENDAQMQRMGDIISDLAKKTSTQAQQIKALEESDKRIESAQTRHIEREDERFTRHEDKEH